MTRTGFYIAVTFAFLAISIPELISISRHRPFLIDRMNLPWIKCLLIIFICAMESFLTKNRVASVAGMLGTVLLFFGIQKKIMHWPRADEMMIIAVGIIFIAVLTGMWMEKRKTFLDFLLLFFVLQRLRIIMGDYSTVFWWMDVITCNLIAVVGAVHLSAIIRKKT